MSVDQARTNILFAIALVAAALLAACSDDSFEIDPPDDTGDAADAAVDAVDTTIPSANVEPAQGCPVGGLRDTFGWCWETPLPHGYELDKIVSPAPGVMWAIAGTKVLYTVDSSWRVVWDEDLAEDDHGPEVGSYFRDEISSTSARTAVSFERGDNMLVAHGRDGRAFSAEAPCIPTHIDAVTFDAAWMACQSEVWGEPDRIYRTSASGFLDRSPPASILDDGLSVVDIWGRSREELQVLTPTRLLTYKDETWTATEVIPAAEARHEGARALDGAGDDVFIATSKRQIEWRRNGRLLALFKAPFRWVERLEARGPSDIWVVSRGLHHWDGRTWHLVAHDDFDVEDIDVQPHGVHIIADGRLYEVVDNRPVATMPEPVVITGVWAGHGGLAAVIGERGFVARWDGTRWLRERIGGGIHLRAITGRSLADLWVLSEGNRIFHLEGGRWERVVPDIAHPRYINGIAYDPVHDSVWFATSDGLLQHTQDGQWLLAELPSPYTARPRHLAVSNTGAVWITTSGRVLRLANGEWTHPRGLQRQKPPHLSLASDISAGETHVWVAGLDAIVHWDGRSWSTTRSRDLLGALNPEVETVAAAGRHAWIGGRNGVALRFDGATWMPLDLDSGSRIVESAAVAGRAWFATEDGYVFEADADGSVVKHRLTAPVDIFREALHVRRRGDFWTFSAGRWGHWRDGEWIDHGAFPQDGHFEGILAVGGTPDHPYAITNRRELRFDGRRWQSESLLNRLDLVGRDADIRDSGDAVIIGNPSAQAEHAANLA